jgi:hypothetical protein
MIDSYRVINFGKERAAWVVSQQNRKADIAMDFSWASRDVLQKVRRCSRLSSFCGRVYINECTDCFQCHDTIPLIPQPWLSVNREIR